MKIRNIITILAGAAACAVAFVSCNSGRVDAAQEVVINEIMPRNRTGLLTEKGKPGDWIELKNTSEDSINLKGFKLTLISKVADAKEGDKKKTEDSAQEEEKTWKFPDVTIGGGECIVIFADNGKSEGGKDGTLSAEFKLPKDGGTLQFRAPNGKVIKELKYNKLSPDQSLALQSDGSYEPTYWQSPGNDNTREGYEKSMEKIASQRKGPLLINEVMSRAATSSGNWVELKNFGDKAIELSEYSLSKKLGKEEKYWQLPKRTLSPGEIITITFAGSDRNPYNSLQAPFKLGDSETLVLSKAGKFVDGVCAKETPLGGSIGRATGKQGFFYYSTPTRNAENGSEGKRFIAQMPAFDKKPGVYSDNKTLCLRLKDKKSKVHYTVNGLAPTKDSPLMGDSLLITKGTVVRTYAEGDSVSLRSNVATATYLLGVKHEIPVMNVTVNNNDLYNFNTGIYANGPGYGDEYPHPNANFWKPWTKDAHVEFFDGKEGFSTDCGLRIFGGFSRNLPKKSFRLKFRNRYGDAELDYDFFGTGKSIGLRDLVLRSGSQDYNRCMVRDEFFSSLMKAQSPAILTQEYRPVALYINAEYFGLYFIREKIDKHFVSRKLNVPNDSINIIMSIGYNEEGSKTAYNELMNYVSSHDLSVPANYAYVKKNVDLVGLIDYKLGEMYSGNSDVGNIRYVRSTAPGSDKKWHFVFYDLDATWVGYTPSPAYYLSMTGGAADSNVTKHNLLINRLLANPEFRALFLERLSHHLANTFSTKNATSTFDALVAQIRPEMKRNCERWPELKYDTWERNVADFKKKFADKQKVMLNDIRSYLKVTPEEEKKYFSKLGY